MAPRHLPPRVAALTGAAARLIASALLAVAALAGLPRAAFAIPLVTVTMISDPSLVLDSNQPLTAGPGATYVAFRVTSISPVALTGLRATISGLANGMALAGGQDAAQNLGTLAAGQSRVVYWFISYPRTAVGATSTLTVSVSDASIGAATGLATVTTRSMISSQAGGNLTSQVIGAGVVLGGIATMDVTYSFGGVSAGDTYNLQPAGNLEFNARCFRLVGTIITASAATAVPVNTADRIFFTATANQGGSKIDVTVRYSFRALCTGATTVGKPFASQQSGGTNLKYSGNFDSFAVLSIPPTANAFTVAKAASVDTLTDGGRVTYTVTVRNTATSAAIIDSVADVLPGGVTYVGLTAASGVTAAASATVPAAGGTGRVVWRGIDGSSYTVPAGGALTVVYQADVPSPEATYTNSATAFAGYSAAGTASAPVVVRRRADLGVTKTGPASAVAGDTLRYALTTSNAGPSAAAGVVVADTLPAGFTFVRGTRGASAAGLVVTWPAVASLANGASIVDTVVVVATAAGSATNLAAARSAALDPVPANSNGSAAGSRATTAVTARVYAVQVTPDTATAQRLPSNGVQYTQAFAVTNAGNQPTAFTLAATAAPATRVSILSTNGAAGTSGGTVTLAAGASVTVNVVYTVASSAAAGDTSRLTLTATSTVDAAVTDPGALRVSVVRAALTVAKAAYRDDRTTAIAPADRVVPGEYVQYKITVGSQGTAGAVTVRVTDPLPGDLAFVAATPDAAGWTISTAGGTLTASLAGTLPVGQSRFFWLRARVR
jgi:uncharacterized repeat protein (TIGR01451 family)